MHWESFVLSISSITFVCRLIVVPWYQGWTQTWQRSQKEPTLLLHLLSFWRLWQPTVTARITLSLNGFPCKRDSTETFNRIFLYIMSYNKSIYHMLFSKYSSFDYVINIACCLIHIAHFWCAPFITPLPFIAWLLFIAPLTPV